MSREGGGGGRSDAPPSDDPPGAARPTRAAAPAIRQSWLAPWISAATAWTSSSTRRRLPLQSMPISSSV